MQVRFFPVWTARLLIDGHLVVANLFPHLRLLQVLLVPLFLSGVVLALLLAVALRAR